MLLHDIRLPEIAAASQRQGHAVPVEPRAGAQYVFDEWSGQRISGGNVGAIRVPRDRKMLRDFIDKLIEKPFETSESGWKKYRSMIDNLAQLNFGEH